MITRQSSTVIMMMMAELELYFSHFPFVLRCRLARFRLTFLTLQSVLLRFPSLFLALTHSLTHSPPISTVSAAGATPNKSSSVSSAAAAAASSARTMSTLVEDDGDDESPHPPPLEEDSGAEEDGGEEEEVEEGNATDLRQRVRRPQVRAHSHLTLAVHDSLSSRTSATNGRFPISSANHLSRWDSKRGKRARKGDNIGGRGRSIPIDTLYRTLEEHKMVALMYAALRFSGRRLGGLRDQRRRRLRR